MTKLNVLLLFLILAFGQTSFALVISDNRLRDPNLELTLARGYSPVTNESFATCFEEVEAASETYRLSLDHRFITKRMLDQPQTRQNLMLSDLRYFLRRNVEFKTNREDNESLQKTIKFENLLVLLKFETSGHSLNVVDSSLSDYSRSLLLSGRISEFIMSCGTHLITNLSRFGYFAVLLTYQSFEDSSDQTFAKSLVKTLRRFHQRHPDQDKLEKEAKRRKIRFAFEVVGLGKSQNNHSESHAVGSIDDLVRVMRHMDQKMQDRHIGSLLKAEALSWLDLHQILQQLPNNVSLDLRQRLCFEENANFISQLHYKIQKNKATIARFKKCSHAYYFDYPIDGPFAYDPDTTFFSDVQDAGKQINFRSLRAMRNEFSPSNLNKLGNYSGVNFFILAEHFFLTWFSYFFWYSFC